MRLDNDNINWLFFLVALVLIVIIGSITCTIDFEGRRKSLQSCIEAGNTPEACYCMFNQDTLRCK